MIYYYTQANRSSRSLLNGAWLTFRPVFRISNKHNLWAAHLETVESCRQRYIPSWPGSWCFRRVGHHWSLDGHLHGRGLHWDGRFHCWSVWWSTGRHLRNKRFCVGDISTIFHTVLLYRDLTSLAAGNFVWLGFKSWL